MGADDGLLFLLPLWEKVARTKSARDEGSSSAETAPSPVANELRSFAPPSPTRGEGKKARYTDAVVTPPSTTMVCPVMKLEASEPR